MCISASINPRVVHASSAQRAAARIGSIHVTLIFNQPSINRPSNSTSTVNQFFCYFDDIHGMLCMHVIQYIARATTSDPSHEPPTCCHCVVGVQEATTILLSRYRPPPPARPSAIILLSLVLLRGAARRKHPLCGRRFRLSARSVRQRQSGSIALAFFANPAECPPRALKTQQSRGMTI